MKPAVRIPRQGCGEDGHGNQGSRSGIAAGRTRSALRVSEIFYSLQGEARTVGIPTVFVRLAGCPLRCVYCDTEYAYREGRWIVMAEILERVRGHKTRFVTVTGGEPLAQRPVRRLLTLLCDQGYEVSLETGGALDIVGVDDRVSVVMDIKTPGSGEEARNHYANISQLRAKDQVKFVICDRNDYEWAKGLLEQYALTMCCEVLVSPSYGQLNERQLADWILEDRLPVRFQIQLHKYLWGDVPGR